MENDGKFCTVFFFYIWTRAFLPRVRFNQLMVDNELIKKLKKFQNIYSTRVAKYNNLVQEYNNTNSINQNLKRKVDCN